jgi:hypothetical protein
VALFYDQLDGLTQGYTVSNSGNPDMFIPPADIFWMNIFGDLEDLEQVSIHIKIFLRVEEPIRGLFILIYFMAILRLRNSGSPPVN